ncbi:amidohydrolase family protein [Pseudomonas sp. NEEL19]|uniref:amidohydrolase family protein n=1 Tax=Pseudomonas sp. NEEL19 TaxID=2867409 RepID=UPI002368A482|nr:amidohydrolase family protein [Pseudomonas sp. NEEL19]WDM57707.1 amidohydrolase family protein [Pseudomonas sp. NEEL19]
MDPKLGDLKNTDIWIENGTIRGIGKGLAPADAQVLEGDGMLVLPGFINTHWHLWNSLLRSSAPIPGGPAFFVTQQGTSKRFTPSLTELSVQVSLAEALHAGFTTVIHSC